jgi:glutathione synthase/RimK-type ligase-like ATP-grasp enzyme
LLFCWSLLPWTLKDMKESVNINLPRQTTTYTCGLAVVEAASILQDERVDQDELVKSVSPDPVSGTSNSDLFALAKKYLKLSDEQAEWHSGLAIANIKNPDKGTGHYVLLLDEHEGAIRYWCPLHGQIISIPKEQLVWTSGDGVYENWFINLEAGNVALSEIQSEPLAFIIGDPIETLSPETDTSLLIKSAYESSGVPVFWVLQTEISLIGEKLYLKGLPVNKNDRVWIRLDPVNTVQYYETLRLLAQVKDVVFLNDPSLILTTHDKLSSVPYRKKNIVTTIASTASLKTALKHIDWRVGPSAYVLKAPSRFGGQAMYKCVTHQDVEEKLPELLNDSGYVIVEPYIESPQNPISTRVFVANGEVIGAVDRVAADGDWRCNFHAGASVRKTVSIPQMAYDVAKQLADRGVFCAGLDFLMGELTEINITCPAAIPRINEVTATRTEKALIEAAWQWKGQTT